MPHVDLEEPVVLLPDLDSRLEALEMRLTDSRRWREPVLVALAEGRLTQAEIREFMVQYYHYARQFISWIGLLLAHSEDDRVRFYLLPHLSDEINDRATRTSHRTLLAELLVAMGVDDKALTASRPRAEITCYERYFRGMYSSGKTLEGLFSLGPGTEMVSRCFLEPMEHGIRRAFDLPEDMYHYFEVHRPEVERGHIESLNSAIRHAVSRATSSEEAERLWGQGVAAAEDAANVHRQVFRLAPPARLEGSA